MNMVDVLSEGESVSVGVTVSAEVSDAEPIMAYIAQIEAV